MRLHRLALLLPLLGAACDAAPVLTPAAPAGWKSASRPGSVSEGTLVGADGVQLFYRVRGTGPDTAIVVTGGPGLSIAYMDRDLTPLEAGRTLIYYDQRGAGYSQLMTKPDSLALDRHIEDLDAVRRHFGLERVSLVGHSWGAMLSSGYAARYPQHVGRLVLVTPGPIETRYAVEFEQVVASRTHPDTLAKQLELMQRLPAATNANALCDTIFDILFAATMHDPAAVHTMRGHWCEGPNKAAQTVFFSLAWGRASLGTAWNIRPMLNTIQAPTLVIHASSDAIPYASTRAYADTIPGAELLVIDRAGHSPWLERPEVFFPAVNRFLRKP